MVDSKFKKPPLNLPPLNLVSDIRETYYKNLQHMDRIDAYIAYDTSMHLLYCKYNPHLRFTLDKEGNPKPRKLLTREDFLPKRDEFGFPLWYHNLSPQDFNDHITGVRDLTPRKKRFN